MEFDNPEVIKSFPGLYVSEHNKKINNETDYSEDGDGNVIGKKELLTNKKKKEKKDKERGYAALEGESSAEENCEAGPSKPKKTKAFKFSSSRSKDKREKSRDKDGERKKDKEKDKKPDKDKTKSEKKEKKSKLPDECFDIAEGLPIFGVPIDISIERSGCHDGIAIPIPVRLCIDHVQRHGLTVEHVYKLSGPKSRVLHLRRLISQRHIVADADLDVPVATSLLKLFLRELPEPLFTADLIVRFEEAGAILNAGTRAKHLRILLDHLPASNKLLLAWLLLHWDYVVAHERQNRMGAQHLASALHSTMHTSTRLLAALLYSARSLFDLRLEPYIPPLPDSGCRLIPDDPTLLSRELAKQESLLAQLHAEIKAGYACAEREERLWEVQRIITQLKRRARSAQKQLVTDEVNVAVSVAPEFPEPEIELPGTTTTTVEAPVADQEREKPAEAIEKITTGSSEHISPSNSNSRSSSGDTLPVRVIEEQQAASTVAAPVEEIQESQDQQLAASIRLLRLRRDALYSLQDSLKGRIQCERDEVIELQNACTVFETREPMVGNAAGDVGEAVASTNNLEHVMRLLARENQILQIKKIGLVRQIIEQQEICLNLHAQLTAAIS